MPKKGNKSHSATDLISTANSHYYSELDVLFWGRDLVECSGFPYTKSSGLALSFGNKLSGIFFSLYLRSFIMN